METTESAAQKRPPSPPARPIVGHALRLADGDGGCFFDALSKLATEYGDFYRIKVFSRPWYVISDENLFRDVLARREAEFPKGDTLDVIRDMGIAAKGITLAEGAEWTRQHKLLRPAFVPSVLRGMVSAINLHARRGVALAEKHEEFELRDLMDRITFSTICDVAFGYRVGSLDDLTAKDPVAERLRFGCEQFIIRMQRTRYWKYVPVPANLKAPRLLREQIEFLKGIIEARRASTNEYNDILSILLNSKYEDGTPISEVELVDQLQTMMGGGTDTSSAVLHWLFYFCSQHPEVAQKLFEEIERVVGDAEEVTLEHVEKLPYVKQVIAETLRLRPALPVLMRQAKEATTLGGYAIEKGAWIALLLGHIHRKPSLWGDAPLEFNPENFSEANVATRSPLANVPFSVGSRVCIGKRLAEAEMAINCVHFTRKFRFELLPGQQIVPFMTFSLGSKHGIRVRRVLREKSGAP